MKILFLEIDTERTWAVASIGPACLAAFLREAGHSAEGIRVPPEMSAAELAEQISRRAPDLLGVSLTTRQWQRARSVIGEMRELLDVPVVAGGLHATFSPEHVLESPGFDFVCLGEGEESLLELVEKLQAGEATDNIRNIQVREGDRPELRPPVPSLNDLPFIARDLLDEQYGVVHMTTQRGCPFPCTYCAARQYHDLYGGISEYGRRRSHESVLNELEEIRRTGSLNYVIFLDDTFTIFPTWVREFCRGYKEQFRIPFSVHARADTVDRDMINLLADAGCRHIVYGVESGSERVRRETMHRPITNQKMIDVFRWTREAKIIVTANYMLGLPSETREDLEQTLSLHAELQPDDFGYFVFYPYPGTKLFHVCREKGYLPDDYLELPANHRESILRLPDLTQADIAEFYDRFTDLRASTALQRHATTMTEQDRAEVVSQVQKCAATG